MKQFIRTSDEETYKNLLNSGFTFIRKDGSFWVFLNDGKSTFHEDDNKIMFTNKYNI